MQGAQAFVVRRNAFTGGVLASVKWELPHVGARTEEEPERLQPAGAAEEPAAPMSGQAHGQSLASKRWSHIVYFYNGHCRIRFWEDVRDAKYTTSLRSLDRSERRELLPRSPASDGDGDETLCNARLDFPSHQCSRRRWYKEFRAFPDILGQDEGFFEF